MKSFILWISVFGVCTAIVYFFLFLRLTYRLLIDYRLPTHVTVRLDDQQLQTFVNKIK